MKKYKIFNKTGLAICLTLGLMAGSACSPTDDGPSIDDHFLNYEDSANQTEQQIFR